MIQAFFNLKITNAMINIFFTFASLIYNSNNYNGPVFLIHVDQDHTIFEVLKETLEGANKRVNLKTFGGRQYDTLYHERDFIPGRLITDNIELCARKCSRAIVILTPAFLKSDWCRYEFTIADSENKVLIVKIQLNDSEEQELNELLSLPENSAIRAHLKSVTYLKHYLC